MNKLTRYGLIHYGGSCKDDYRNIVNYNQHTSDPIVKLQRPAMRSLKASEQVFQRRSRDRKGSRPIRQTGTWRSCQQQADLYRSDRNRFAPPNVTGHTRGLCIDVRWDDYFNADEKQLIRRILLDHGWHQARPIDEPWHFSYGITV